MTTLENVQINHFIELEFPELNIDESILFPSKTISGSGFFHYFSKRFILAKDQRPFCILSEWKEKIGESATVYFDKCMQPILLVSNTGYVLRSKSICERHKSSKEFIFDFMFSRSGKDLNLAKKILEPVIFSFNL